MHSARSDGEVPEMSNEKTIRQWVEEFLLYKKTIGYVYETPAYYLYRYVDFIEKLDPDANIPEKSQTEWYLDGLTDTPGTLYGTVAALREFSRYMINRGQPEAYVVPPKRCRQTVPEPPYFFTEKEIEDFFSAVDTIEALPSFKGRDLCIPAMLRLMYCCGLRNKEVCYLKCRDVHLDKAFIDLVYSKGPKSRRIFISNELKEYLSGFDSKIMMLYPEREYFFPNNNGRYAVSALSNNFKRFWAKAYPDFEQGSRPRVYDFRHHFAWANLNRWASEGMDVNVMLAYLMRYMGHQTISETLYYFHFVPEFFPKYREMTNGLEDILPEVGDEN